MRRFLWILLPLLMIFGKSEAKVDLVTLPKRDKVQLTIYNSADMTLVRENRALTLKKGTNSLQFSWANTLIDPTSLEMMAVQHFDRIHINDLTYPPRMTNLGVWHINSDISGEAPVEITYLTSGLTWRAFYMVTLSSDEKGMDFKGYVRVTNNSGEDYETAQIRMIVGQVHILDEIVALAKRKYPYGRPGLLPRPYPADAVEEARRAKMAFAKAEGLVPRMQEEARPKEIEKEGLSEYFLYTIEGTETIPNGWSKRLPSFRAQHIPVVNLYKYDEERFGPNTVRFLSFKNDEAHKLGETPLPEGVVKVYRTLDPSHHLTYEGRSDMKYIPLEEEVELNLGPAHDVSVEPILMDFRTDGYLFDPKGNIRGWNEIRTFKVEVKNRRSMPAKIEITRHFETPYWEIGYEGDYGLYEKIDVDSAKFTLQVEGRSERIFKYTLTTRHGQRAE